MRGGRPRAPTWSFGRITQSSGFDCMHGPGELSSPGKDDPPSSARSEGGRKTMRHSNLPGPGAYNPRDPSVPSSPSFSLRSRPPAKEPTDKVPGPGFYSQHNPYVRPRGIAMGLRLKDPALDTAGPGPAAYEVDAVTTFTSKESKLRGGKRAAPSFTFGRGI